MKRFLIFLFILSGLIRAEDPGADYYKELSENIKLFFDVMYTLNENYVDTADIEDLMSEGIKAMLAATDPYTVLLKEEEEDHYSELTSGTYGGIGIYLGTSGPDKRLTVISPIDDTPASKVGLRAGDRIMYIDDQDTKGMTTKEASGFLKGDAGTKVVLRISRPGEGELLKFIITRADINIKNVPYSGIINGNTGYLKLSQFTGTAYYDVKTEVEKLISDGAKSIILDLRFNPGGLLGAAVKIANVFIPKDKLVVSTRGRGERIDNEFMTYLTPADTEIPLAVLINGSSASASEITAGCLQDHDRAVIIGEPSFGKGLVQQIYDIGRMRDRKLKVTIRKYYTPCGRLIQKEDYFGDKADNGTDTIYFETLNTKRKVPSGEGIVPDIFAEPEVLPEYIASLRMNNHFSDFVYSLYKNDPDFKYQGSVDGPMIDMFAKYLKDSGFEYRLSSENAVDSLEAALKKDHSTEELTAGIEQIKREISEIKKNGMQKYSELVKKYLNIEFSVYEKGTGERYRILNMSDPAVLKAVEILSSEKKFKKALGY